MNWFFEWVVRRMIKRKVEVYMKAGIFTTEFWLTAASGVTAVWAQFGGLIPDPWGITLAAVGTAVYTIARAWTKTKVASN